jgi:hypothetical protein
MRKVYSVNNDTLCLSVIISVYFVVNFYHGGHEEGAEFTELKEK